MNVLALRGKSNVGKTSILKKLMKQVVDEEQTFKKDKIFICKYSKKIFVKKIDPNDDKWFTTKAKRNISNLTILTEYKGKIIVISSMGDSTDLVVGSIEAAKRMYKNKYNKDIDVDVYICACRKRMKLENMLNCNNVNYIDKDRSNKKYIKDNIFVEMLINELNKLI